MLLDPMVERVLRFSSHDMTPHTRGRIIWAAIFGITMGFFEAAIVVYLRRIAYPEGFSFPLVLLDPQLMAVEITRELVSLVMIASVAHLAGRRALERFAYFILIFGVWDILYYVFLKLILGWPASLLETDILFLIPVPWVGPVLAPVLVALVMIVAGIVTIRLEDKGRPIRVTWRNLGAEIACALIIIVSFCLDWRNVLSGGQPRPFAWWLFFLGLIPAVGVFFHSARSALRTQERRRHK